MPNRRGFFMGLMSVMLGIALQAATVVYARQQPERALPKSGAVTGVERAARGPDGVQVFTGRAGGTGTLPDRGGRVYQGVIAPGNSPGCIVDEGQVTFSAASTLTIEIGGQTACTEYDRFTAADALTLSGGKLKVVLINGFTPQVGQIFDVLNWGTLAGTFGTVDLTEAVLGSGLAWGTSRLYSHGELVVARDITAARTVPLPPWMLAALAIAILVIVRRGTRTVGR